MDDALLEPGVTNSDRWVDVFPWIGDAHLGEEESSQWTTAPDEETPDDRAARLDTVVRTAMAQRTHWSIGRLVPRLGPTVDLWGLEQIPTRARNALVDRGLRTAAELAPYTVDDLLSWRSVGVGTIEALLRVLAETSCADHDEAVTDLEDTADREPFLPPWLVNVMDDLTTVSDWLQVIGLSTSPILRADIGAAAPQTVRDARSRLDQLRVDDINQHADFGDSAAIRLDDALNSVGPRDAQIVIARHLSENRKTLADLGEEVGVTRERVRQIESKAMERIRAAIAGDEALVSVRETARELAHEIRPLDDLLVAMPALAETVVTAGVPAWRVLSQLDGSYEIRDSWCVKPTMTEAQDRTRNALDAMSDPHGVARVAELDLVICRDPNQLADYTERWLRQCGFTVLDDFVLTRTGSIPDFAAAFLSIAGEPLTLEQIVERLPEERAARSVANRLAEDARFVRVDVRSWSLREWGMTPYKSIRAAIQAALADRGGSIELKTLVAEVTGRYDVSPSSVIAYAAASPFETVDGVVRTATQKKVHSRTPGQTRRLFRWPNGWGFRTRVNAELLRGSGFPVPFGVAAAIGLEQDTKVQFESRLGEHAVSWKALQPVVGSIRRFLIDDEAIGSDSEVFLFFADDGTFDVIPCRKPVGINAFDALALIGSGPVSDEDEARSRFASAAGLADDSTWPTVRSAYATRGDDDLAAMLPGDE